MLSICKKEKLYVCRFTVKVYE